MPLTLPNIFFTEAGGNQPASQLDNNFAAVNTSLTTAATIASATSTDLGSVQSNIINITGTNNISGFGSSAIINQPFYIVRFSGILTLVNSASLVLQGGSNITTAAGDTAILLYLGTGNWALVAYFPATTFGFNGGTVANPITAPAFIPDGSSVPTNGMYLPTTDVVAIATNGAARIWLDSVGAWFLGTLGTDPTNDSLGGVKIWNPIEGPCIFSAGTITTLIPHMNFINGNGLVGSISTNGSATAFNTSSDARLKDNISSLGSDNLFDNINPVKFTWKSTGEVGFGFIAQELYNTIPCAVTVGDNAMNKEPDDEGFEQWMIDQSKIVPFLVAEIKSLRSRILNLEEKS